MSCVKRGQKAATAAQSERLTGCKLCGSAAQRLIKQPFGQHGGGVSLHLRIGQWFETHHLLLLCNGHRRSATPVGCNEHASHKDGRISLSSAAC